MESQMRVDIGALSSEDVQSAALRVVQNELDLRLLYEPVIDVDLARLKLWTRQVPIDVAADDTGLVLADVAALDRVWERTRHGVDPAAATDAALQNLRKAADAEDLGAVDRAAGALTAAVDALHTR
jgi:predicted Rdx family selenoprotein